MTEQWLARDEMDLEIVSESALAMAQATIQNAMDQSGVSRADLARRIDTPRSYVSRILNGSHNLTVKTLARCLGACGYELEFALSPVQWNWSVEEPITTDVTVVSNQVPSLEGTLVAMRGFAWPAGCPSGR